MSVVLEHKVGFFVFDYFDFTLCLYWLGVIPV